MNSEQAQLIMAYHDDELPPEDKIEVERLIERDGEAQDFLNALLKADQLAGKEFANMLAQPVPGRLVQAARGQTTTNQTVVEFPDRKLNKRWTLPIAASVLVAVVLGTGTLLTRDNPDQTNQIYANLLNTALESTPSGDVRSSPDGTWQVMPVTTFETQTRGICREYASVHGNSQFFGLACRDLSGQWSNVVQVTFEATTDGLTEQSYIPATGEADLIASKLAEMGDNRIINFDEEQAMLQRNWR